MAVYKNMIQHIGRHVVKMARAGHSLELNLNVALLHSLSELATDRMAQGVLRFYAFSDGGFGYGKRNEAVNHFLHFQPSEHYWTPEAFYVVTYPYPIQADAIIHRHKTLAGLPYVLASNFAAASGAHDCLLTNLGGNIASLSSSCIFWGFDAQAFVIPTMDGSHAGTMRSALYSALRGRVEVQSLPHSALSAVKWMVGVNSLAPRLVTHVDGRSLTGPPPYMIEALSQVYPFLRNLTAETIQRIGFAEG